MVALRVQVEENECRTIISNGNDASFCSRWFEGYSKAWGRSSGYITEISTTCPKTPKRKLEVTLLLSFQD